VEIDGPEHSPHRIRVRTGHPDAPPLALTLTPFRELSSWASLLQSYEEWVLSDGSGPRRSLAASLIGALPLNVDHNPARPSSLLLSLCHLPTSELPLIDKMRQRPGIGNGGQVNLFEEFWAQTLPAALDLPFRGVQAPFANLRGLLEFDQDEASGRAR
jgi:hypothetical protein